MITIALLSYSTSWSRSSGVDCINSSTGGLDDDSVIIAISDLRIANSKMIELEYEKEINRKLKEVVESDSVTIQLLKEDVSMADKRCEESVKKVKTQRNILGGSTVVSLLLLVLSLL